MKKLLFILLFITASNVQAQSNVLVLIGPKFNFNISKFATFKNIAIFVVLKGLWYTIEE